MRRKTYKKRHKTKEDIAFEDISNTKQAFITSHCRSTEGPENQR